VLDPNRAIREVENYLFATSQLAQVTLRSVCGQGELDELLAERDKINARIQTILDAQTDPWGIKVVLVELKHIDLPQEMQRAMAKQAESNIPWPYISDFCKVWSRYPQRRTLRLSFPCPRPVGPVSEEK